MKRTGVPPHVQAFVAHTMGLAQSGSTEEVLAAFFYGREDIIPEMFRRLQKTLPGARQDNDPLRSTTSIGTLSWMATLTVQRGESRSKIWSGAHRRGTTEPRLILRGTPKNLRVMLCQHSTYRHRCNEECA